MEDPRSLLKQAIAFELALQGPYVPIEPAKPEERAAAVADETPPLAITPVDPAPLPPPSPIDTPQRPMTEPHAGAPETPPRAQDGSPYKRIEALIAPTSPLHAMTTLDEVRDYVASTVLIPLDTTRINPVFGVGNPHADLMVIGEAPGADEDQKGEPFVGRAGQLLTKILEAIHFTRDDVYIANILKSRPPNNRDPLPDEVAAHIPILYKQIALIQPKLILCVGKTAGNNLLEKQVTLASLRGKFNDFHGIPTMVTYHPAALLRNPQWKRPTWEDVQMLRDKYDELTAP
ncbi:MAG: uracil-DNA glycosylase [Rhodothermales bacterium]